MGKKIGRDLGGRGKFGTRNHRFFDSLSGMANALAHITTTTPKVSGGETAGEASRSKMEAKLARRAARAKKERGE